MMKELLATHHGRVLMNLDGAVTYSCLRSIILGDIVTHLCNYSNCLLFNLIFD